MNEKASPDASREQKARDRELASRFLELLGAMKRYVREHLPSLAGDGMSEERFRTLLTLKYHGKGYLKTLAAYDGVSSSALCIMLNHMVEEGFAARTGDQDDRRNVAYELTDAGAQRLTAEIERRTDHICAALDQMGSDEKSRFGGAIETLLAGIDSLGRGA